MLLWTFVDASLDICRVTGWASLSKMLVSDGGYRGISLCKSTI
jgi:hypothetical protein